MFSSDQLYVTGGSSIIMIETTNKMDYLYSPLHINYFPSRRHFDILCPFEMRNFVKTDSPYSFEKNGLYSSKHCLCLKTFGDPPLIVTLWLMVIMKAIFMY